MHQPVGYLFAIAVAAEKCLEELSKRHGVHPQIVPAFGAAQLDGAFDTKFGFDNTGGLYRFFFLLQRKDDFDTGRNISTGAMGNTSITEPAPEQVAQIFVKNQAIIEF